MPFPLRNRRIILPPLVTNNSSGPALTPPVTSGLILQLDANQGTSTTTNNTALDTFTDVIGSNAFTSTGSNRPTYVTTGQNGLPVVRFNGSNFLQTAAHVAALDALSTALTIFWWAKCSSTPFVRQSIFSYEDSANKHGWGVGASNNDKWTLYYGNGSANNKVEANSDIGAWHGLCGVWFPSSTTEKIYEDGTSIATAASDPGTAQSTYPATLGAIADNTANQRWTGDFGELLIYNVNTLTAQNISDIFAYGRTKWGTP